MRLGVDCTLAGYGMSSSCEDEEPGNLVLVNGHASVLLQSMNELRTARILCDVMIKCEGIGHSAHRVVLAASSSYFKAMFTSEMKEKEQHVIELKGISSSTMSILLDFVYTEAVSVDTGNVQDLLPAACLLQLKGVENACCEFLKGELDPMNCLSIKMFANTHQCMDLAAKAEEYCLRHFNEIVKHEEFLDLEESNVVELIKSSEIEVNSEEDVYQALLEWVTHKESERGSKLAHLLEHVRLPLLSARFITDVVDNQVLIKSNLRCRDLLDEAKRFHLRPELRASMQMEKNQPRYGSSEVMVILGGFGIEQTPISSVEMYNPKSGNWANILPFTRKRRYLSAVAIDNRIYVIGGYDTHSRLNTVECLDFSIHDDGIWYSVSPMHMKRGLAGATVLGNLIYVAGGFDGTSRHSCAERYDPRIDEWSLLPDMTSAREGAGVVSALECIYCLGGYDGMNILNTAEKYDPKLSMWTSVSRMTARRSGAGAAFLNHLIYVMGGFDGNCHLDTVESYNVHTDSWTSIKCMSVPRCYVNACILRGKLHAVAGYDGEHLLNSVEQYSPSSNTWKQVTHMSAHRCDAGVAIVKMGWT